MLLKILQNLHENTCARVSFLIKLRKTESARKSFPVNFAKSLRTLFSCKTPLVATSIHWQQVPQFQRFWVKFTLHDTLWFWWNKITFLKKWIKRTKIIGSENNLSVSKHRLYSFQNICFICFRTQFISDSWKATISIIKDY